MHITLNWTEFGQDKTPVDGVFYKEENGKQSRPRSDCSLSAVWSGSTLFAAILSAPGKKE